MKGNNEFRFNKATIIAAVQCYLDTLMKADVEVYDITYISTDSVFIVKLKEGVKGDWMDK